MNQESGTTSNKALSVSPEMENIGSLSASSKDITSGKKSINSLISDIHGLFEKKQEIPLDVVSDFADAVASVVRDRMSTERGSPYLRLSNLGTPCKRKLWYDINASEIAEPLPPSAKIKFLFGDILEELLFFFAKVAGHEVTDRQKEVSLHGVKGHIDGRIDGVLVDAKSASTYSFQKFERGLTEEEDAFGYLTQLDGYMHAEDLKNAAFLAIDKTLGHIALDHHSKSDKDYAREIPATRAILDSPVPPPRGFHDIPEGKSGNRKLGVECSYCSYKFSCWPSLRAFGYARGPVFLTHVAREPDVPEIK